MQVVAGGIKPSSSAALHSSRSEMTQYRGAWTMMLQVPSSVRAALAKQPTIANGMFRASPLLKSLRMDSTVQLRVPRMHMPSLRHFRSFHCRAGVLAPSEAGTHVMTPDASEDPVSMQPDEGPSGLHPQVQGATHPVEISPKFAEALQSFEALHARLQASRMTNAIGQAELDALEASLCCMEETMSMISLHEHWHMGSSCLKLAWLYLDAPDAIKEPLSSVLTAGHRALKFLETLQTPVWTIVSCSYVLGHTYLRVGKFSDAVRHLEKAATIIKDLERKEPPNSEQTQLVNAVHSLLQDTNMRFGLHICSHAREYLLGGNDPQFYISTLKGALELVKVHTDPDSTTRASQLEICLGFFHLQTKLANEAVPHFKNSLAMLTRLHGPNGLQLATVHNHLGVAYTDLCKLNDALKHFETAKRILSNHTLDKKDGTEITLYNNIAQVYALRGRFDDAIRAQKRLIEIIKQNMVDNIETPFVLEGAEETLQEMYKQAKANR